MPLGESELLKVYRNAREWCNSTSATIPELVWTDSSSGSFTSSNLQWGDRYVSTSASSTGWVPTSWPHRDTSWYSSTDALSTWQITTNWTSQYLWGPAKKPTGAELQARRKKEMQRRIARNRSYELLYRHLTDEQKTMLENEDKFLVVSQNGGIYEIRRGKHLNIFLLGVDGKPIEKLCCHPADEVPEGDAMLAQMLHLMTNEDHFRKKANKWKLN